MESNIELIEKIRQDNIASVVLSYQQKTFPKDKTVEEILANQALRWYLNSTHGLLYQELRDNSRLCYSTGVDSNETGNAKIFNFLALTGHPDKCHDIKNMWLEIIKKIADDGISQEDLEIFRDAHEISVINESSRLIPSDLYYEFRHGITIEKERKVIESLTPDKIARAAKELADSNYVFSIALPIDYKE